MSDATAGLDRQTGPEPAAAGPRSGIAIAPLPPTRSKLRLADPGHPARHQLDEVEALIEPCITLEPAGPGTVYKGIPTATLEQAVGMLDETIGRGPADPDLLVAKGCVLQAGAQYASAHQVFEQAVAIEPEHFEARMWNEHLATWAETFYFPGWDEAQTELHPVMARLLAAGVRTQVVRDGLQKAVAIVANVPDLPADPRTKVAVQWTLSETPQGPLVAYYLHIDPPSEPAFNDEAFLGIAEPQFTTSEGYSLIGQLAFTGYCFVVLVDNGRVTFNRRIVLPKATALKLREIECALAPPRPYLAHEANQAAIQWHMGHFDMSQLVWDEGDGSVVIPLPVQVASQAQASPATPTLVTVSSPAPTIPTLAAVGAPAPVAPSPVPPPAAPAPPAWEAPPPPRRGRTGRTIGAIVASIALLGGILVAINAINDRGTKTQPSGQSTSPVTSLPSGQAGPAIVPPPTGLTVEKVTLGSVTLSWDPPSSGGTVPRYRILRDGAFLGSVPAGSFSYVDEEVVLGTTYHYQMAAMIGSTSSELSPEVVAKVRTPGLAAAHLTGGYTVKLKLTSVSNFTSLSSGRRYSEYWSFNRRSASRVVVEGESPGGGWTMKLVRHGSVYSGRAKASLSSCWGVPVRDTITLQIRIVKGRVMDAVWQGVRWQGTFTDAAPYTSMGLQYCPGSSFSSQVAGMLG
jgi:hypothetical protein